jgi:hypothetical protein
MLTILEIQIMNNSTIRRMLLSGVAVAGLAACSSSSDDPVTTTPDPEPEPPVQQFASSNGLPYAGSDFIGDAIFDLDDDESRTITLRALRILITDGPGAPAFDAEVLDLTLTFTQTAEEGVVIQANLDGETALIGDNNCFTSSTGQSYCIDFQYGGFEGGNVVLVYSDGGVFDVDGVSTELAAWVGLETDPEWLAGKGVTFYEGSWYGILSSQELDFANLFEGEMGMQANFQTGDIEGKMFSNLEGPNLNAEFSGSISGNGFTAEIDDLTGSLIPEGYEVSENIGQLEGRFYGVTGEEAAGTIVVDVEITDDGEEATTYAVSGGGLFQLNENPYDTYENWID